MTVLANFPHVDQLNSPTLDGRPDENKWFNCVPSSICAGLRYLTGDQSFEPDQLKDAAYPDEGEAYANMGTSASKYVDLCAQHGIQLYSINGSPVELVSLAHQHLALDHPVVFTEPSPYANPSLGYSHVCVFFADGPGYLTAMDPFGQGGHDVTRTDEEWSRLLQFGQIWIMEKETMRIDLNNATVASFFSATPDGSWYCKQTGHIIQFGILAFYRSYGQNALCGLTYLGLPRSNEIPVAGHPGVVKQQFERGWVAYDPGHVLDYPPAAGDIYLMHLPE